MLDENGEGRMIKTAICTGPCKEELELRPCNFNRNKTRDSGYSERCKACTEEARARNDAIHERIKRLPHIKLKAANILYACGFSIRFIARDLGETEYAVRNSVSAEPSCKARAA